MQRHARAHITGRWRGTEITPWSIILWKLKGPPAGSRRLCTEKKKDVVRVGLCPHYLKISLLWLQRFSCSNRRVFLIGSCFYVSWFSPPHPFLSCLFKPNDLYHFIGRAQGKRWKLGSRSMNINKTFYTPSKGQSWHFFLPSPPPSPLPVLLSIRSPFPHCLSSLLRHHSIFSEWKEWVVLNTDLIGPLSHKTKMGSCLIAVY